MKSGRIKKLIWFPYDTFPLCFGVILNIDMLLPEGIFSLV
ncbi:hypothetical protein AmDm5_1556 [Acetobacter malorum]|nr:hypothetical protein AmDm5_1556 [Acetobacter malorum]